MTCSILQMADVQMGRTRNSGRASGGRDHQVYSGSSKERDAFDSVSREKVHLQNLYDDMHVRRNGNIPAAV